ncbi:hypothetical protein NE865_10167 [Phthorimaea operculella]|nr:hypothetical protein NE865_10167 [Phthorimaea operculella]
MAGVLFIVNVPRKEYEADLNRDKTTKTVIQKDKYARVSKLVDELKENKRFGSLRTNIETYAQEDDNVVISKCKSTDRLHKNDKETNLYKSKSATNVSEGIIENDKKKSFRASWSELKHVINPRRSKLKITRPGNGVDILASFHWDTPLETILYEVINRLNIKNATWNLAKNSQFWQVIFSLESGCQCEELLQVLRTFGVGSRHQSSVSVIPCALYYKSTFEKRSSEKDGELSSDGGAWSRFSSSVRSRTNLAQVLHEVRAEAALTFDWIFLLVVAAFVAAIGLVENSTIILVASMLISPLMVRAEAALTFPWIFLLVVAAFVASIGLVENSTIILVASMLISPLMEVRAEAALTFDWIFLLVVAAFVAAIGLVENSTIILVASMLISPLMVRAEAALTFDWIFLLVVAAFVAAIGLVENSTIILVASMLISPLMGPITAGTLGTTVRDRSLQQMGVTHELLGLFMSLVIGFIFGLAICAVDERYGVGDWPTYEMMSRCEIRSLWVGILVAIPSGAGVALAVLGDYTASLVGVAISASLLPPAVNAGLLWAMALVHLIFMDDDTRWTSVVKTTIYSDNQPTELAVLGAVSLCLTLVNILCIFLAGVAVYKVKEVCPLEQRDISWWRSNKLQSSKKKDKRDSLTKPWDLYRWRSDLEEKKAQDKRTSEIGLIETNGGTKLNRPLTPVVGNPEVDTVMTITGRSLNMDNYVTLNVDTPGMFSYTDLHNKSADDEVQKHINGEQKYPFYSIYDSTEDENKNIEQNDLPTLEPSLSYTVDQNCIVLAGVVFVICIPSSNYEHVLKFGKPREIIPIEEPSAYRQCRLEVELRNKKSRSIPVHLTQEYYNEAFNPTLENINEDDEFITMESILQELLRKLNVEHVVWVGDKTGNYFEVIFPLPTGDPCETMLHCLTKLGIGVRCRSIVSVVPCNVVHSAIDNAPDEETVLRKAEDANRWRSFVESIRSKLTVKQVVDGVRGGGELNFDYLTLIITAESKLTVKQVVDGVSSNLTTSPSLSRLKQKDPSSFVESIRSKLTVKQVVDGVRGGGEPNFDYLTLITTAESKLTVKQVVDGVRGGGELNFDYLTLIITAESKLTVKQVVDGVRGGGELNFDYLTLIITAE